jgi:hypothetical protein
MPLAPKTSRTQLVTSTLTLEIQPSENDCRVEHTGVASLYNLPSGKVDMKTDVLNETTASTNILKIKMGLFRFRGSPVWKSSFTCGWRLGSSQPLTPPDWF